MQTHKNPTLRTGPAPFKAPSANSKSAAPSMPVDKPPSFVREGKKWLIVSVNLNCFTLKKRFINVYCLFNRNTKKVIKI